jgi:hypothetical protein
MLAALRGSESERAALVAHIAPFAWQTVRLGPDCLPEIMYEIESNLSATARMFGVPLASAA